MPRSMWRGVVSFGMVSIPVRLHVATESSSVSFRQLCPEHLAPIRLRRFCTAGDHEVAFGEIVKGYEVSPERYVVIEDAELENLPLPTSHAIEIGEFLPRHEIPAGLYYRSAYYVEPEEAGRKPYHLLRQALAETDTLAVARIAFRDREHLCALTPVDGMILLNTLHWPDEIRATEGLRGLEEGSVAVSAKELAMAKSLVQSLAEERFDPSRYTDRYRDALMEVVQAKIEGEEVVTAPEPEAETRVMDLMEALKASVETARRERAARAAGDAGELSPAPRRRAG